LTRALSRGTTAAGLAFGAVPVIFLCIFLVYPMGRILAMGAEPLLKTGVAGLRLVTEDTGLPRLLAASAGQALLSTALTLVFGLPIAWIFSRYTFPGKSILRTLLLVPFVLPTVVVGSAFVVLIGSGGVLEKLVVLLSGNPEANGDLTRSLIAVLLAHAFYNTAIVVRIVGSAWSGLDPRLHEAAAVLGAGRARAFSSVTLRLLVPSIAASCILVFAFCFSSFGIVLMLGGPRTGTLETEIYRQSVYMFNLPAASFLSIVQLLVTVAVMFGYARIQSRAGVVQNLKPGSVTQRAPSTAGEHALVLVCGIAPVAGFMLPLAALLFGSFQARGGVTTAWWQALFAGAGHSFYWIPPLRAAMNSLVFALEASAIAVVLGVPSAYLIARGQSSRRSWGNAGAAALDLLFLVPLGTSAVTLGFGFIVSMSGPPLDLQGSAILIPVAHSLVALPLVIRSLLPGLRSINPRLRDAAAVLGAGPASVRRNVDLPILRRSFLAAAAFAFTVSLGEFGATAMLTRPELVTLPVLIFDSLSRPGLSNQGQAMALGSILMASCGIAVALIERVRPRGAEAF
jgi:thiamine transport system permease protein